MKSWGHTGQTWGMGGTGTTKVQQDVQLWGWNNGGSDHMRVEC